MNDQQYLEHCCEVLQQYAEQFVQRTADLADDDSLRQLALGFSELATGERDLYLDGPGLVSRLFNTYPDFAPEFPRELLWFMGGECLHYMPDDEIDVYQQLDELRTRAAHSGELIDFRAARAKLLKTQ